MRFKKHFRQIINKKFPLQSDGIMALADERYQELSKDTQFSRRSVNPLDKRLDFTAYFLATIQSLEHHKISFDNINTTCKEIAHEYVRPKNNFQKWFKKLLPRLINTKLSTFFLNKMDVKIRNKGHTEGFRARVITDKAETFGFGYGIDILECGICKLFHKHHADHYAAILCEVDKITSGMAGLQLIRQGTIANGAQKCDFRFKRQF